MKIRSSFLNSNLTLKKIPKAVLSRCEWGKDDYSLQISELKPAEQLPEVSEIQIETTIKGAKKQSKTKSERRASSQLSLFGGEN